MKAARRPPWGCSSPDSIVEIVVETEQRGLEADVLDGINAIQFSNDAALDNAQFLTLSFTLMNDDGSIVESDMLVNDRAISFTTTAGGQGRGSGVWCPRRGT